jgi:hypothetical protein
MPLKATSIPYFNSHSFNIFEMAEVQSSEVDDKPVPVSLGLLRVQFGNHGNQTIVVWKLKPYLCNKWSIV